MMVKVALRCSIDTNTRGLGTVTINLSSSRTAYFKDLKSSNVQDANERGSLSLGLVQSFIDSQHQPAEHPLVRGFGQSLDCKLSLLLSLGLLHIVPANLDTENNPMTYCDTQVIITCKSPHLINLHLIWIKKWKPNTR